MVLKIFGNACTLPRVLPGQLHLPHWRNIRQLGLKTVFFSWDCIYISLHPDICFVRIT